MYLRTWSSVNPYLAFSQTQKAVTEASDSRIGWPFRSAIFSSPWSGVGDQHLRVLLHEGRHRLHRDALLGQVHDDEAVGAHAQLDGAGGQQLGHVHAGPALDDLHVQAALGVLAGGQRPGRSRPVRPGRASRWRSGWWCGAPAGLAASSFLRRRAGGQQRGQRGGDQDARKAFMETPRVRRREGRALRSAQDGVYRIARGRRSGLPGRRPLLQIRWGICAVQASRPVPVSGRPAGLSWLPVSDLPRSGSGSPRFLALDQSLRSLGFGVRRCRFLRPPAPQFLSARGRCALKLFMTQAGLPAGGSRGRQKPVIRPVDSLGMASRIHQNINAPDVIHRKAWSSGRIQGLRGASFQRQPFLLGRGQLRARRVQGPAHSGRSRRRVAGIEVRIGQAVSSAAILPGMSAIEASELGEPALVLVGELGAALAARSAPARASARRPASQRVGGAAEEARVLRDEVLPAARRLDRAAGAVQADGRGGQPVDEVAVVADQDQRAS